MRVLPFSRCNLPGDPQCGGTLTDCGAAGNRRAAARRNEPAAVRRGQTVPALSTREDAMSKSVWPLAVLVALGAATPALAQYGENGPSYDSHYYFSGFEYRPFHAQIEGGLTLP